jgi:hypothetical protein
MTNPDNPFLPPEPPSYWSLWIVIPSALLGIPLLGIGMIFVTPHKPSTAGSEIGLLFFPFLTAGLAWAAGMRVEPGAKRMIFMLLSGGWIMLWLLVFFVGMLAP